MYMLFVFGREVERFIGRRAYIALYLILLIAPPACAHDCGLWQRSGTRWFARACTSGSLLPSRRFIRELSYSSGSWRNGSRSFSLAFTLSNCSPTTPGLIWLSFGQASARLPLY
jgi:hypothetical protein